MKIDLKTIRNHKEQEAHELIKTITAAPFRLDQDVLIRVVLVEKNHYEYILILNLHHIISDGWTKGLIARKIIEFYNQNSHQHTVKPDDKEVQYFDYIKWQQDFFENDQYKKELAYWKTKLSGASEYLNLPTDYVRPPIQTSNGSLLSFEINPADLNRIRVFCQSESVSPFMFFLTLFFILLYRYTDTKDILIGTPIFGRRYQELEDVIGVFINTLVMRCTLQSELGFSELLQEIKKTATEAYSNQSIPFEKLIEELNPRRTMSHSPLFQVFFTYQNTPVPKFESEGLSFIPREVDSGTAQFDLSLIFTEVDSSISEHSNFKGVFSYNSDLFKRSTIQRMKDQYLNLVGSALENPKAPMNSMNMLSGSERKKIMVDFNQTKKNYPRQLCIHQLFEEIAEKHHQKTALLINGQAFTYQRLNEYSNQIAHYLLEKGVKTEETILILLPSSFEWVAAVLGVLKSGASYVPLDTEYPKARITDIINDSESKVLISTSRFYDLKNLEVKSTVKTIFIDKDQGRIQRQSEENPHIAVNSDSVMCVIYTSGTTGRPKGVLLEHRNICNLIYSFIFSYAAGEEDVMLPLTSVSSASFTGEILPILCSGGTILLLEKYSFLDRKNLVDTMNNHKVTIISSVPSMLYQLNRIENKLDSVRLILSGGDVLLKSSVDKLLSSKKLVNGYGVTEASICSTYNVINAVEESRISIGKPIMNTRIYILDEYHNCLPIGCPGEIYIAGDGVSRGYFNRAKETEEKFVRNPFNEDETVFKTGDFGIWQEDGTLLFLGRKDRQINIRGTRIEIDEIEEKLMLLQHIEDVAVALIGEQDNENKLAAYIVFQKGVQPDTNEIRQFLLKRLPDNMIPSYFIPIKAIPRNPNGKLDIAALPGKPSIEDSDKPNYQPPKTDIETSMTQIWQTLLNIEKIGIHDNFFDLGGHSLLVTQLQDNIRKTLNKEISIVDLFRYSSISSLSGFLESDGNKKIEVKSIFERAQKRKSAALKIYHQNRKTRTNRS